MVAFSLLSHHFELFVVKPLPSAVLIASRFLTLFPYYLFSLHLPCHR